MMTHSFAWFGATKRRSIPALVMALLFCISLLSATYADAWDSSSESVPLFAPQELNEQVYFTGLYADDPAAYHFTEGERLTLQRRELALPVFAEGETVAELLFRLNIRVNSGEAVLVDFTQEIPTITVASDFTCEVEQRESVPYTTRYEANSSLPWGEEKLVQAGADGYQSRSYRLTVKDGQLISSLHLSNGECTMQEEVIQYGTRTKHARVKVLDYVGGTITVDGEELDYSKCLRMTGTAYTAGIGVVNNITATGTQVHVGVVAVDQRVIPLGTKLFIEAANGSYIYGTAVAEDTGVRGNVIDLYMNTYEDCVNFGARPVNVYILNER